MYLDFVNVFYSKVSNPDPLFSTITHQDLELHIQVYWKSLAESKQNLEQAPLCATNTNGLGIWGSEGPLWPHRLLILCSIPLKKNLCDMVVNLLHIHITHIDCRSIIQFPLQQLYKDKDRVHHSRASVTIWKPLQHPGISFPWEAEKCDSLIVWIYCLVPFLKSWDSTDVILFQGKRITSLNYN